jgi:hypothetical protein
VTPGLPTPGTTLRARYARVLVFCNSCRHQADAVLQAIVASGRGDVPLTELRFRCSQCGTDRTDFVLTSGRGEAVVSGARRRTGGSWGKALRLRPVGGAWLCRLPETQHAPHRDAGSIAREP